MKLKTKLLLIAAFLVLAPPLALSGVAVAGGYPGGPSATPGAYVPPAGSLFYIDSDNATPNTYGGFSYTTTVPTTTQSACQTPSGTPVTSPAYMTTISSSCTGAGDVWYSNGLSDDGCLRCHSALSGDNQVMTYLLTGHRNMLRMVTNSPVDTGTAVNLGDVFFSSNNSLGSGCTYPQYLSVTACTTNGGTYTSTNPTTPPGAGAYYPYTSGALDYNGRTDQLPIATNDYYIYGGWWESIKGAQIDRQTYGATAWPAAQPGLVAPSGSYTCAQCHTTGYMMPGAANPSNGAASVDGGATWYVEGVGCGRCHGGILDPISQLDMSNLNPSAVTYAQNYTDGGGGMGWNAVLSFRWSVIGAQITGLCHQCHVQQQSDTVNAGNNNTATNGDGFIKPYLLAVTGSVDPGAPNPLSATPGGNPYTNRSAATFPTYYQGGNYQGNQFLNSPHARFTGTSGGVARWDQYNTNFVTTTSACTPGSYLTATTCTTTGGGTWSSVTNYPAGCTRCHNVHRSSVDPNVLNLTNPALDSYSNISGTVEINSGSSAHCGTNCHGSTAIMNNTSPALAGTTWNGESSIIQFNHPMTLGAGTPFDEYVATGSASGPIGGGNNSKALQFACVTCHMGPGTNHLFRVQVYQSDNVTPYTINAGTGGIQAAATFTETFTGNVVSGSYPYAIGMDVGLVCGQCHDQYNAPVKTPNLPSSGFTTTQLAAAAFNMHMSDTVASAQCLTCHSSAITDTLATSTPAISATALGLSTPGTHHPDGCTTCHGTSQWPMHWTNWSGTPPSTWTTANTINNVWCQNCHVNSITDSTGTYAPITPPTTTGSSYGTYNHHLGGSGGNCTDCHGTNGGGGLATTDNISTDNGAYCQTCHASSVTNTVTGSYAAITPPTGTGSSTSYNHHVGGTATGSCTDCHGTNGGAGAGPNPTTNTYCQGCHASSVTNTVTGSYAAITPPTGTGSSTSYNHHVGGTSPGNCTDCHGTNGGQAATALPATNTYCQTCHASTVTTTVTGSYAAITSSNHHTGGLTGNCTDCHGVNGGQAATTLPATNAYCTTCHNTTVPATSSYYGHHSNSVTTTACTNCHGTDGGAPNTVYTNASCATCHASFVLSNGTSCNLYYTSMDSLNCTDCHGAIVAGAGTAAEPIGMPGVNQPATGTCTHCHGAGGSAKQLTNLQILADIPVMHASNNLTAGFTYSYGTPTSSSATYPVNVQAVPPSVCPGTDTCTYGWSWGDSNSTAASTTTTASHTYGTAGTYTVQLTMTDTNTFATANAQQNIIAYAYTAPPTATGTLTFNANTWMATVHDTSSGNSNAVVAWGDGLSSGISAGGTVNHTYANPAGTNGYTVTLKSLSSAGGSGTVVLGNVSPQYFSISGNTYESNSSTPVVGAVVIIKRGSATATVAVSGSGGAYTAGSLKPGTYSVCVSDGGETWPACPQISSVTLGPNATGQSVDGTSP